MNPRFKDIAASTALQPNRKTRRRAAFGIDPRTPPNTTRTPPSTTRDDGCDQPKSRLETSPAIPGSSRELTPPGFAVPRSLVDTLGLAGAVILSDEGYDRNRDGRYADQPRLATRDATTNPLQPRP
jgi:hypothetical protein